MADYLVEQDAWIDGRYRKAGDVISLSEAEAKYLVLSGVISDGAASRKSKAAPATETDEGAKAVAKKFAPETKRAGAKS